MSDENQPTSIFDEFTDEEWREADGVRRAYMRPPSPLGLKKPIPEKWDVEIGTKETIVTDGDRTFRFFYDRGGEWLAHPDYLQMQAAKIRAQAQIEKSTSSIIIQNGPPVSGPRLDNIWMVKGLIPTAGQVMLYGQPGSGKSFVSLNLAMHIAAGIPWNGRRVKQGITLYIALEGTALFGNRIIACANGMGIDVPQEFAYITLPLDLGKMEIGRRINERMQEIQRELDQPVQLVIIDTLNRAFPGKNENSAEDMGEIIKNVTELADGHGGAWMVVHHEGVATGRARGSTALLGAVDTEIKERRSRMRMAPTQGS